jgi:CRP-like cAMP-binding protein
MQDPPGPMKNTFEIPHCETCLPRLHSIFGVLSGEELAKLELHKGCNFHRSGQVLFYEGDYPSGLYCINRGKVKLTRTGEAGREQIVRLAREGDSVGYRALVSGTPYELTATVIEDASICFIPRQTFHAIMVDNPSLTGRIIRQLTQDLAKAEQKQVSLAQKQVRERLAETLLMLREFYGCEDDHRTLRSRLSREDIANYVGTATETVIRLLSEFSREGLIVLDGKQIRITDIKALRDAAHLPE